MAPEPVVVEELCGYVQSMTKTLARFQSHDGAILQFTDGTRALIDRRDLATSQTWQPGENLTVTPYSDTGVTGHRFTDGRGRSCRGGLER